MSSPLRPKIDELSAHAKHDLHDQGKMLRLFGLQEELVIQGLAKQACALRAGYMSKFKGVKCS